jgi:uncharacterized protein (DUF983 family)
MATNEIAPTTTTPGTGIKGLCCPKCGEANCVTVKIWEPSELHCNDCGEALDRGDIEDMIAKWTALLGWLDSIPSID